MAYNSSDSDDGNFLVQPFQLDEVRHGIKTLTKGKAVGFDDISSEHLAFGGGSIAMTLPPAPQYARRTGIHSNLF